MMRREFITLLGGAAAAWPLAARAQERMRRVGVLSNPGPGDAEMRSRTEAFAEGLRELGWTSSKPADRLPLERWKYRTSSHHAAELIALEPDVVLATSGVSIMPLLEASRRVPIVFAQTINQLASVSSKARPGREATSPA